MGMYSYLDWEDIKVKDWNGLKDFIKRWKGKHGDWPTLDLYEKEKKASFEPWSNTKLISYWYTKSVVFLHCVANYIDGELQFSYETGEEMAIIKFNNGKCIVSIGHMEFNEYKPTEIIKKEELEKFKDIMIIEDI